MRDLTMNPTPELAAVMADAQRFPANFQSLHLATSNDRGEPEASYAPYLEHEGSYYVYVSELSAHTGNLAATGRCSVLFIESETQAKHLFARRRLTLQCVAQECPRDGSAFEPLMDRFAAKFGNFVGMLRKLTDFHLYQLSPQSGAYVAGFAQAYTLEGDGLREIRHRQEQGHRSPDRTTTQAMDALTP
jgi:heme iron utilization protein